MQFFLPSGKARPRHTGGKYVRILTQSPKLALSSLGATMKRALILAGLVFAAPAPAGDIDCNRALSQSAMNICADRDYRASDARLNATYTKLMSALGDIGFKAKLKASQRAWIEFRDRECTYQTADNEGGSIHPMVYAGCLARLTKARTRELESQLVCWKNAEKCGM
jgi:uncharacterized protein YecT (DUF1311 family)